MKHFSWNKDKNLLLKRNRGISFEEIVYYILKGQVLDVVSHPNQEKYKDQKLFIIEIEDYAYLVPFIENKHEVFLKTIIPSRKATKKYLRSGTKNE